MRPILEHENFILYHGDSLRLLPKLEKGSVDMIFADPPYNLSNGGFTCNSGKRAPVNKGSWDESQGIKKDYEFHKQWIKKCGELLKKDGTIWISGTYHSIYTCGFALLTLGFKILNDIAWFKPNASPNLSCRYFTASHETLLWAKKEEKEAHYFDYKAMKDGKWEEDRFKNPGKQMRSVWSIPTPPASEKHAGKHPTQKPLALLKRIIIASSREGGLILDPFSGSGTTGIAAMELNRRFIGIEKELEYIELTKRRYEEYMKSTQKTI